MAGGGRDCKFLAWETCCCYLAESGWRGRVYGSNLSLSMQALIRHYLLLETSYILERHQSSYVRLEYWPTWVQSVSGRPTAGFGASSDHQIGFFLQRNKAAVYQLSPLHDLHSYKTEKINMCCWREYFTIKLYSFILYLCKDWSCETFSCINSQTLSHTTITSFKWCALYHFKSRFALL